MQSETLGFIGAGSIADKMVRGFLLAPEFTGNIVLWVHKNTKYADALKALAPERIIISYNAQEIIDKSDAVFIAVLPTVLHEALSVLKFTGKNHVISIVGGSRIAETMECYKGAASICRAIPLPFCARRIGPVLLYGKDELSHKIMSLIGKVVTLSDQNEFDILGPITGMMVPYFAFVAEYAQWAQKHGMSCKTALDYTCYMNSALSDFMQTDCTEDFEAFLTENATPGGVNELGLKVLREKGTYDDISAVLEVLYNRYNRLDRK